MKKIVKGKFPICLSMILSLCLVFSSSLVYATDSVESLKDETSNLDSELSSLNSELDSISNELDITAEKLEKTTTEVVNTTADLAKAKAEEIKQYSSMKLRIKYIYETGNTTFFELLITADSMADFLNKAEFVSSLSSYDRNMLTNLLEIRDKIRQKEDQLKSEQLALASLKDDLDNKELELTNKIGSTSSELSVYQERLNRAKAAAAAAQSQINKQVSDVAPTAPEVANPQTPEVAAPPNSGSTGGEMSPDEELPAPSPPPSVGADTTDVNLLASIIECEAGGSSFEGQVAVGAVVLNRVRHASYPNTIRGVIYQSGQFSPVASGKLDKVLLKGPKDSCIQAAVAALNGSNPIGSCLSFRAASTGHAGINIGGNVFF